MDGTTKSSVAASRPAVPSGGGPEQTTPFGGQQGLPDRSGHRSPTSITRLDPRDSRTAMRYWNQDKTRQLRRGADRCDPLRTADCRSGHGAYAKLGAGTGQGGLLPALLFGKAA